MNLYLYRRTFAATYTGGHLYDGVSRLCDTLEDPVRNLVDLNNDGDFDDLGEGKVYGATAIPAGTYIIKMRESPHFGRVMPYLQSVPGFSYIMIHPGNGPEHTKGCILVGESKMPGRLVNSRAWSDIINSKLIAAESRGEENRIIITDDKR